MKLGLKLFRIYSPRGVACEWLMAALMAEAMANAAKRLAVLESEEQRKADNNSEEPVAAKVGVPHQL